MITEMTWPFHLPPLSYPYDALEPFIDRETMHLHHDKHFQTYIDNLNAALKNTPEYHSWTLTKLLTDLEQILSLSEPPSVTMEAVPTATTSTLISWPLRDRKLPQTSWTTMTLADSSLLT